MHVRVCVNVVVLLVVLPTGAAKKCGVCEKGLGQRRCKPCPPVPVTQGEGSTISTLPSKITVPALAKPLPALLVPTDNAAAVSSTTTLPSGMLVSSLSSTTPLHQLTSEVPLQTYFYSHGGATIESGAHELTRTTAALSSTTTLPSGMLVSSLSSTTPLHQLTSEVPLQTSFYSHGGATLESGAHELTRTTAALSSTTTLPSGMLVSSLSSTTPLHQLTSEVPLQTYFYSHGGATLESGAHELTRTTAALSSTTTLPSGMLVSSLSSTTPLHQLTSEVPLQTYFYSHGGATLESGAHELTRTTAALSSTTTLPSGMLVSSLSSTTPLHQLTSEVPLQTSFYSHGGATLESGAHELTRTTAALSSTTTLPSGMLVSSLSSTTPLHQLTSEVPLQTSFYSHGGATLESGAHELTRTTAALSSTTTLPSGMLVSSLSSTTPLHQLTSEVPLQTSFYSHGGATLESGAHELTRTTAALSSTTTLPSGMLVSSLSSTTPLHQLTSEVPLQTSFYSHGGATLESGAHELTRTTAALSSTTTLPSGMLVSSLSSTTPLHQLTSEIPLQTSFYSHGGKTLESGAHELTRTTAALSSTTTLPSGMLVSSLSSTTPLHQLTSEIPLQTSFYSHGGKTLESGAHELTRTTAALSSTTTLPSGMLVSSLSSTTPLHQLTSEIPLQTSFYSHGGKTLESDAHELTRTTADLVFTGKDTPTLPYGIPTSSPLSTSTYDVSTQWSSEISLGMSFSSSEGAFSTATQFNDVTPVNAYSSDVDHSLRGCEVLDCTFKPHSGPVLLWTMLDSKRYHMRAECAEWCGRLADCTYFVYVADSEMCNVYASDGTQSSESEMMIWIKFHC